MDYQHQHDIYVFSLPCLTLTLLNRKYDVHHLINFQNTASLHTIPAINILVIWQFIQGVIPTTNKLSTNGLRMVSIFRRSKILVTK